MTIEEFKKEKAMFETNLKEYLQSRIDSFEDKTGVEIDDLCLKRNGNHVCSEDGFRIIRVYSTDLDMDLKL